MTSLIHPRGSLRRFWSASPSVPRRPCGGGLVGRITAWDAMGYHGITWASINRPDASASRLKRNLHGPLMGCPLKEWLRGNSPCVPLRPGPRVARGAPRNQSVVDGGALLTRLRGSKQGERLAVLASCSGPRKAFLFLDGTNAIGGHKMIKTLMISAAVGALMVSGALAQADMSRQTAAKTDAAPAVPHDTAKFIAAQG